LFQIDWALHLFEFLFDKLAVWMPVLSISFFLIALHFEGPIAQHIAESSSNGKTESSIWQQSASKMDLPKENPSESDTTWQVSKYHAHQRAYDFFVNIMYGVSGLLMLIWPWMVETADVALKVAVFLVFLTVYPPSSIRKLLMHCKFPTIAARVTHKNGSNNHLSKRLQQF